MSFHAVDAVTLAVWVAVLLFVVVPLLALLVALSRAFGLGEQFSLLRRRLGMSRPLGWTVGLLALGGFLATALLGDPPDEGTGEYAYALAGALWVAGVAVAGTALARLDWYRTARTAETHARDDAVLVSGAATALEEPTTAPLSGEPALAYRYRVSEVSGWGHRRAHVPKAHAQGGVPFQLDDGSGPVVVDPAGAQLSLQTASVDADDLPPSAEPVLASVDGLSAGDDLRFREWRLPPGDTATALGTVVDRPDPDVSASTAVAVADAPPADGADPAVGDTEPPGHPIATAADQAVPHVVATGDADRFRRRLGLLVRVGGPGGVLAAAAGLVGMAWYAGLL